MARERRSELHMELAQVRAQIADLDGPGGHGSKSEERTSSAGAQPGPHWDCLRVGAGLHAHGVVDTRCPGAQAV